MLSLTKDGSAFKHRLRNTLLWEDLPGQSAEKEVGGPEGGQVHRSKLGVPAAVLNTNIHNYPIKTLVRLAKPSPKPKHQSAY